MLIYTCNLMHVEHDDQEPAELMNTNSLKEVKQFLTDNFAGDKYVEDHFSMDVARK